MSKKQKKQIKVLKEMLEKEISLSYTNYLSSAHFSILLKGQQAIAEGYKEAFKREVGYQLARELEELNEE